MTVNQSGDNDIIVIANDRHDVDCRIDMGVCYTNTLVTKYCVVSLAVRGLSRSAGYHLTINFLNVQVRERSRPSAVPS